MDKNNEYGIFNEVSFLNEGTTGLAVLIGLLAFPAILETGCKIFLKLHDAKRIRLIEECIKSKINDKNLNDIENRFGRIKNIEFAKLYEELNDKKLIDSRFKYNNVICCAAYDKNKNIIGFYIIDKSTGDFAYNIVGEFSNNEKKYILARMELYLKIYGKGCQYLCTKKDMKDAGFSDVNSLDIFKSLNEGLFKKSGNTTEEEFKEAVKEFEKLVSKFKSLKTLKINGFKSGRESFRSLSEYERDFNKGKEVFISFSIVFEESNEWDNYDIEDALDKIDTEFYKFAKSLKFIDVDSNYKNGFTANQSDVFKWCGISYTYDTELVLTCYIKRHMRRI